MRWNEQIIDNENAIAEAKAKWQYFIPSIIKQAQTEKGVHIEKVQ